MNERIGNGPVISVKKSILDQGVDKIHLMGTIVFESFTHPEGVSTLISDELSGDVEIKRETDE